MANKKFGLILLIAGLVSALLCARSYRQTRMVSFVSHQTSSRGLSNVISVEEMEPEKKETDKKSKKKPLPRSLTTMEKKIAQLKKDINHLEKNFDQDEITLHLIRHAFQKFKEIKKDHDSYSKKLEKMNKKFEDQQEITRSNELLNQLDEMIDSLGTLKRKIDDATLALREEMSGDCIECQAQQYFHAPFYSQMNQFSHLYSQNSQAMGSAFPSQPWAVLPPLINSILPPFLQAPIQISPLQFPEIEAQQLMPTHTSPAPITPAVEIPSNNGVWF